MVVEAAIFMAIIVFVDGKYYRLCRKEADIAALAQGTPTPLVLSASVQVAVASATNRVCRRPGRGGVWGTG